MTFSQPTKWDEATGVAGQLTAELSLFIRKASDNMPRSLQSALGPSEIGEPCARKLAYAWLNWERTNESSDPLPSIMGTGAHAWMAEQFSKSPRYLVEHRIHLPGGISGSLDLYDLDLCTVVDWKFPGATAFKRYVKEGPSDIYRVQSHLYGYGLERAGQRPQHVAIAFLPRAGMLSGMKVWSEPYDRTVAERALERLEVVTNLVCDLNVEDQPENWNLIPSRPSAICTYCPWHLPMSNDLSKGCPGQQREGTK